MIGLLFAAKPLLGGAKALRDKAGQGISTAKKKTIDTKKFLKKGGGSGGNDDGGSGGGGNGGGSSAIVLRSSSKLAVKSIKPSSFFDKKIEDQKKTEDGSEDKKVFESILNELSSIKETLTTISELVNSNFKKRQEQLKNESLQRKKRSYRQRESELEKKKKGTKEGIALPGKPKLGLFDTILNYFTNVFLGSLAIFALSKLPQIIAAFNTIGKNLTNTFNQIKYIISSLTTNFPRQIKAVASLFKKIVTSKPAQAIGKLLSQAGKVVANIFAKASKAIFNIIKGPVKNILGKTASGAISGAAKGIGSVTKRGIGKAIPRAAAKLGGKNAAAVAAKLGLLTGKGVKHFAKIGNIFKRIPFIGALIGIGIDLALGVPPDAAVAGAIGASLGASIGGAIGTGVIPIPGVGTFLGGIVGAAVGDWAGKEIYKNLKGNFSSILPQEENAKVTKKAEGGKITSFTRETEVEKRTIRKIVIDKPLRRPGKAQPISKRTEDDAKKYLFKGEKSSGRFNRLSKTYSDMRFVGTLLKLGIDIGMGEKPTQTNINVAADSLAYSVAMAIKNENLELPGVNKNTSGTISNALSSWARKEIYTEIMNKRGELALRESEKDEGGGLIPGMEGMGVYVSSDSPDFWLLATAALFENSDPQGAVDVAQAIYNRVAMPGDPWKVNNSIRTAILNPGQFQPVRQYGGTSAWASIKTKNDAMNFVRKYGKSQAQLETVAAALLDKEKQKSARDFVGPRDSFRAEAYEKDVNHLANETEKTRHGHTFGFEPRGATIGAFKAGKLTAAMVSDTIKGEVTSAGNFNIIEYITGDVNHPNLDVAGHGTRSNYHDHIAFKTIQDKENAKKALRAAGIQIGSELRRGDPGYHGSNLAIDIPGFQWGGRGAIGSKEFAGSAKVRSILGIGRNAPKFHGGLIKEDGYTFLHKGEYVVDKDSVDTFGLSFIDSINRVENKTQLSRVANKLIEDLKKYDDSEGGETVIMFPLLPKQQSDVGGGSSGVQIIPVGGGVNNRATYDTVFQSALYKNG